MHALPVALTALIALASAVSAQPAAQPVSKTASEGATTGVLRFTITDQDGQALPARLTFLAQDGTRPDLFTNPDADPDDLAVRANVIYSLSGTNAITVPVGRHTVWVSRGMEYGVQRFDVEIGPGATAEIRAALHKEIDTTGWISGDYHLHTLTHSGHGDSNMPERIISLAGEGVEFAVATDHNHNTDYRPTMDALGAKDVFATVTGNEVSTPVGHFNAFPLDPAARLIHYRVPSAIPLFAMIREEQNQWGITPVIQVNHPRWGDINYFGKASLDPVAGDTASEVWSADFDTIEIFNENEGWGYYDPDETDLNTGEQSHSVLHDWFNLLNRGHAFAAVGNSDSHDVASELAGIPRNYTPSATDTPADIDPAEVARMLRAKRVFTTTGPFVDFSVNGTPMGGSVMASPKADGTTRVSLDVRVQAASWIDVDRVKIVVNGDVAQTIPVPQSQSTVRLDESIPLDLAHDSWVSLLVEGDTSMDPIMHDQGRPLLPLAVTNPVWVDADADGAWTPAADRATALVQRAELRRGGRPYGLVREQHPTDRAMFLLAAGERQSWFAADAIREGLVDADRKVRLAAVRAAQSLGDPALEPALATAAEKHAADGLMSVSLLFARAACSDADLTREVIALLATEDSLIAKRYRNDLVGLVKGRFITQWQFAGYFDCPEPEMIRTRQFGPEQDAAGDGIFETRTGRAGWTPLDAYDNGFIDLQAASNTSCDNAISYVQSWIVSPDDREITFTLGSDDAAIAWVNDQKVYDEIVDRGASPLQHVGTARLKAGANRVLLKVQNGGGEHGAYFRVLDDEVTFSRTR